MQVGSYEAKCKASAAAIRSRFFPPVESALDREKLNAIQRASDKRVLKIKAAKQGSRAHSKKFLDTVGVLDKGALVGKSEDAVLSTIARHYDLSVAELKGKSRHRIPTAARQEAYYWLKELFGLKHPKIGAIFSWRHPSTVFVGLLDHKERRERLKEGEAV